MATKYFEFVGPKGAKFWEITVDGAEHTVRFGKVGANGQSKTKAFDSPDAARADADKLIRSKVAKGYVEAGVTAVTASTHDPEIAALVAQLFAELSEWDDPEDELPRPRPPATDAQIAAVEAAWGRPLPPSYRAFLAIHNGIENFQGSHLLLGTEDHLESWAREQIAQITEFWNEDEESEFDIATVIPLAVPDGDFGIRDFRAFERGDAEELEVVDWDTGEVFERFPSFKHYLASLVVTDDDEPDEIDEPPDAKARALFALDDPTAIAAAVEELVAAGPTIYERNAFARYIDADVRKGTPQAIERAELLFRAPPSGDETFRVTWVRAMNNAIASAYNVIDLDRKVRWADAARPYVLENAYMGHNLACIYVAAGRMEDAFEMCEAAVATEYPDLAQMRVDTDLGPLLDEPRFQALFEA